MFAVADTERRANPVQLTIVPTEDDEPIPFVSTRERRLRALRTQPFDEPPPVTDERTTERPVSVPTPVSPGSLPGKAIDTAPAPAPQPEHRVVPPTRRSWTRWLVAGALLSVVVGAVAIGVTVLGAGAAALGLALAW